MKRYVAFVEGMIEFSKDIPWAVLTAHLKKQIGNDPERAAGVIAAILLLHDWYAQYYRAFAIGGESKSSWKVYRQRMLKDVAGYEEALEGAREAVRDAKDVAHLVYLQFEHYVSSEPKGFPEGVDRARTPSSINVMEFQIETLKKRARTVRRQREELSDAPDTARPRRQGPSKRVTFDNGLRKDRSPGAPATLA
jgi:hypothetical protein